MTTRGGIDAEVGPLLMAGCLLAALAGVPGTVGGAEGKEFAYPKGIAGEIAEAYIEVFSTGEDSLMTGFYETYLSEGAVEEHSVKTRVWEYHRLYGLFGELAPHQIIKNDKSVLVLLVKSEKLETWFHVSIEMDEAAPGLLLDMDVQPAARPK